MSCESWSGMQLLSRNRKARPASSSLRWAPLEGPSPATAEPTPIKVAGHDGFRSTEPARCRLDRPVPLRAGSFSSLPPVGRILRGFIIILMAVRRAGVCEGNEGPGRGGRAGLLVCSMFYSGAMPGVLRSSLAVSVAALLGPAYGGSLLLVACGFSTKNFIPDLKHTWEVAPSKAESKARLLVAIDRGWQEHDPVLLHQGLAILLRGSA